MYIVYNMYMNERHEMQSQREQPVLVYNSRLSPTKCAFFVYIPNIYICIKLTNYF